MLKYSIAFLLLALMSFTIPKEDKITVYLIGDSTMAIKEISAYPETGWGMPFVNFFDSTVVIDNRAKNGRSTRTFIEENRWTPVVSNLKPNDFVFIQFGHNDEVQTKPSSTTEIQFKAFLTKYVLDTKLKKANPILLTPVARRKFDTAGKLVPTHDVYAQIVRDVSKQLRTPLIDMDLKSQALLQSLGEEKSKFLYNHLLPGEHPNYPEGKIDDTHFNELGARLMAQLVLSELKNLNLELSNRIIKKKK